MATLNGLPADQRAVLQLVLQSGRSYDDIAALLAIDRAAVRDRALSGLDTLGPETEIDPGHRALITDYLLGQLPPRVSDEIKGRLAGSAAERAWARVVAAELAPLSSRPLPEIPAEAGPPERAQGPAAQASEPAVAATQQAAGSRESPLPGGRAAQAPAGATGSERQPEPTGRGTSARQRPSSRRGGAILLGAGLLIGVAVVVVILARGSGSSGSHTSSQAAAAPTTPSTSTSGTASAKPVATVTLTSPSGNKHVGGAAIVVKTGTKEGLVIRAQGVPANSTHDAYAVWLYNSPADSRILGFVNPGVKTNGVLQTLGALPAGASRYKQLLVTLETQQKPTAPTKIVLQGALSLSG